MIVLPHAVAPPEFIAKAAFIGNVPEIAFQALLVSARNNSVSKLRAKVWMDGEGPMYFSWSRPKSTLDVVRETVMVSQTSDYMDLVKDEAIPLPVWMAQKGDEVILTLNTEAKIVQSLKSIKPPYRIEMHIQFIGENYTDKNRRKFTLLAASWEELSLVKGPF